MRVQYTDGPDAVDIHHDGQIYQAERGTPVDLPVALARDLVKNGWQTATEPKKRAVAKKAPAKPVPRKGAKS